ncbi:MAG: extracellular solute-binding protein [Bacilli bacterium]
MKKSVVLLSLVALSSLVASCNGTSSGTTNSPIEIVFGTSFDNAKGDPRGSALNTIISNFETENPDIKVTNRFISAKYNEIQDNVIASFSTATFPDMVLCYADHIANYIKEGYATNLDPLIKAIGLEDEADYLDLEQGRQFTKEGTYMVPFNKSTEYMLYNKGVLEHLDLSKIDNTINNGRPLSTAYIESLSWEELFGKLCPALVTYNETLPADKKIIVTDNDTPEANGILAYESDQNFMITLLQQYGLPYLSIKNGEGSFDFNDQAVKDLVLKFNGYANKGYFSTKGSSNKYNSELMATNRALFEITSSTGTSYFGSSSQSNNTIKFGFAKVPTAEGKEHKVISQGTSICLLTNNKQSTPLLKQKSEAAFKFYKFLTNKKNSVDWAINSGYEGIRKSVFTNEDYKKANDITQFRNIYSADYLVAKGHSFVEQLNGEYFTTPVFVGSSEARNQMGGVMTKLSSSSKEQVTKTTIDAWFTEAMAKCQAAKN